MLDKQRLISTAQQQAALAWAGDCLNAQGYALQARHPAVIRDTPWSYVVRYAVASHPDFFLKLTPTTLPFEPTLYALLEQRCEAPVPQMVAQQGQLSVF